jgi:hypothetical protein
MRTLTPIPLACLNLPALPRATQVLNGGICMTFGPQLPDFPVPFICNRAKHGDDDPVHVAYGTTEARAAWIETR